MSATYTQVQCDTCPSLDPEPVPSKKPLSLHCAYSSVCPPYISSVTKTASSPVSYTQERHRWARKTGANPVASIFRMKPREKTGAPGAQWRQTYVLCYISLPALSLSPYLLPHPRARKSATSSTLRFFSPAHPLSFLIPLTFYILFHHDHIPSRNLVSLHSRLQSYHVTYRSRCVSRLPRA